MAVAALAAGCGDDESGAEETTTTPTTEETTTSTSTITTVPEREPSTTTTAFDPVTVEGEVEAAYLRSWDVYAEAVYNLELDEQALAEVYAEPYLTVVQGDVDGRIQDGRAAHVQVDHNYEIEMNGPTRAVLVDRYVNHQVLIDPQTKQPVEADPNEIVVDVVTLLLVDGSWKVTRIEEFQ